MNEYQLRNEIAKKIREIDTAKYIRHALNYRWDTSKDLKNLMNEVLAVVLDVDLCELCELIEMECECVFCKVCGRKELDDEIYEGRCRACEDKQMIRGIK